MKTTLFFLAIFNIALSAGAFTIKAEKTKTTITKFLFDEKKYLTQNNQDLISIYKKIDVNLLKKGDSLANQDQLDELSISIKKYMLLKYKIDFDEDGKLNSYNTILFGSFFLYFELYNLIKTNPQAKLPAEIECLAGAIGTATGAIGIYQDIAGMISNGVSAGPIWSLLKKIAKQYFSWFTFIVGAWALYDCFF